MSTTGCSQAHVVTCVLGSSMSQLQRHLCACERVRFQVIHVIAMLVLAAPSLSQPTTTRSTTCTARSSPRTHNFYTTTFSENRKLILLNSRLLQGRKESLQVLSVTTKPRVALQFDKFPNPQSFMTWKTRFKTQVSSGSDFPSDAVLWIKEVEMVDSLDGLKSSRSVYGKDCPDFEMLDAKNASAQSKIIQNSQFNKKSASRTRKAPKVDRFLGGRQNPLHDLRLLSSDWAEPCEQPTPH